MMARKGKRRGRLDKKSLLQQRARQDHRAGSRAILARAERLIEDGQPEDAREILEGLEQQQPQNQRMLQILLDIYHLQRDFHAYSRTADRLSRLIPDDADYCMMSAGGFLATMQPVRAWLAFNKLVHKWPDHPMADDAREQIEKIKPAIDALAEQAPFPPQQRYELMAMHEQMLFCLSDGQYDEVIRLGEKLLARQPDFVSAKNNCAEAYFQVGQPEKAIELCEEALRQQPENVHAVANLARFQLLGGRFDEANETARRLLTLPLERSDSYTKVAETLTYFGDDLSVLNLFERADRAGLTEDKDPVIGVLHHLVGVASARQGDWRAAKRHWRKALKIYPDLRPARENLADADRPAGEINAPWADSLLRWIPQKTIDSLLSAIQRSESSGDDEAVTAAVRRFAEKHPHVTALVPILLDRGDEGAREFAIRYAKMLETPEMFHALREFCLSDRGTDDARMDDVAMYLKSKDELPPQPMRVSHRGQWCDVELHSFEVTDEPSVPPNRSPRVNHLAEEAFELLQNGDGEAAERRLREAIEIEPDAPDLHNNLATALKLQDRDEEADQLSREIHNRWPDYFFGCVAMAHLAMSKQQHEQAEALLEPLKTRPRLHRTEFTALCTAYIRLYLMQDKRDAASTWLSLWKQYDESNPEIARFERMLKAPPALTRWLKSLRT